MKRWISILLTTLLVTVLTAAGYADNLDQVCQGAERTYRIDGEVNSTWAWTLVNPAGDPVDNTYYSFKDFSDFKDGEPIQGSEITITWNLSPGTYTLSAEQTSEFGCENFELGTIEVLPNSVINAGPDLVACDAQPVTISSATGSDYSALLWTTSGDGAFDDATLLHPVYTPGAADIVAGTVTLELTANGLASNGTCEPVSDEVIIQISNLTVTLAADATEACLGSTVSLEASVSGGNGAITHLWTGNGSEYLSDTSIADPVFSGAPAGVYTLSYTATDAVNCEVTENITITIFDNPLAEITANGSEVCEGNTIQLDGNPSGGSGTFTKHEWTSANADNLALLTAVDIQNPVFISAAEPGTYTFTYTVTDDKGCIASDEITLTVHPLPTVAVTATPAEVCQGTPIQLQGTPSGGSGTYVTHLWTADAGVVDWIDDRSIQNPVFTGDATPGTYILTFTVTDDKGCEGSGTVQVTVNGNNTPIFTQVGPYCNGATIAELPTTSENGITGTWTPAIDNTQTTIYTFTPDAGQCATTATMTITIDDQITPIFTQVGPYCNGATIAELPTTSENGITGTWTPAIDNTQTTTYTFTPDAGQCATTATMTITIDDQITPIFTQVGPYCNGATIAELPTTSENGITGIWTPAIDNTQTTTYTFTPDAGQCATTATMTITIDDQITPVFAQVGPYCEGTAIAELPTTSENGITGTWAPAIDNTQTTTYTFTPDAGLCATTATMTITIDDQITPIFTQVGPFCNGITIAELPTTSENGITGTWTPAIDNTQTTTYTFTPDAGQCATTATMTITIDDQITPIFTQVGPFCTGTTIADLPTTSENGITGTWAPAIDNTQTTIYTFTPDAGQCATTATMTITIDDQITPVFAQVGPFCTGTTIAELPTTSENGITGTWAPAIDNTQTTIYTFTPDAGQCATTATMTITIDDQITPVFAQVGPYCEGATIAELPTTSENGITGTWAPAIDNTQTNIYTFTPDAGQCATTATMTITIDDQITPIFTQVGPFCNGATIAELPTTSENGITGTWTPAIDNTQTTTYTFTPDAGQCATTATMTITIDDEITPIFTQVGPYCNGTTIAELPTTSENGITGTWTPAIDNTQTTTYTFTPDAGQCATTATMTITIDDEITPIFTQVGPYCNGTTIADLPTTSENGITGTWTPAIDNTQTTTYTFTPDPDQCGVPVTMTITIDDQITPIFTQVGPYCNGTTIADLPTTSENGITGTWAPAIDNTQTTTYTFTPDPDQCGVPVTMTIEIDDEITPIFTQVGPFCTGTTIADLPTTSENGITGTWAPAIDNTQTTTYTFTPDTDQCGVPVTMIIEIEDEITPIFTQVGPFCAGTTIADLPTTSENGITGIWAPAIDNTQTTTYTFTPDPDQCGVPVTMTIEIEDEITPIFTQVGPFCAGTTITDLPTTSENGITGTWAPAIDNTETTTYTFTPDAGQCATIATMTITIDDQITPIFTQVGPFCAGTTIADLPTTSENGITGIWAPAIDNTQTTTYTFTPDPDQCGVPVTMTIEIEDEITPIFTQVGPFCTGTTIVDLPTTSENGITGTWTPAIDNTQTTTYTFTPDPDQCGVPVTMTIEIEDEITPIFTQVGPFCEGSTIAELPTTSENGITGTWAPAIDNTQTTTYTFTPDPDQCGVPVTMTIEIEDEITPVFTQVGPFCTGTAIADLPTTSENGITGTWAPAIDNTQTTTYTFTPDPDQCGVPVTMTIEIEDEITPIFTQVGPFCAGTTIADLPTTSENGITGTWAPAIDNTQTTSYTFTPDDGQCATTATMTITIDDQITPIFTQVGPFCTGTTIADLPTTSENGITGTWAPAIDNTQTTTYTFTPDAGQCATTATMTITIDDQITPIFAQVGPFCTGTTIADLPTTSENGITGTWAPAIDNTQTTTYTFTPDPDQCGVPVTMTIEIEDEITPIFTQVGPFCTGTTIADLPTTSENGITGTWAPAIDNTQTTTYTFTPDPDQCGVPVTMTITIDDEITPIFAQVGPFCTGTAIAELPTTSENLIIGTWAPAIDNTQTTTYTFTPDAGQCATTATMTITINEEIIPVFAQVGPYCNGATIAELPTTSENGITGTWTPAIDNTQTTTYTFTPDAGQCATTATMTITIDVQITPIFAQVGPYCNGATIAALPTTSENGINGTWTPAIDNTQTTTYTFTPDAGQCATTATMTITIQNTIKPEFNPIAALCVDDTPPTLPTTSLNGISGTWTPGNIDTSSPGTFRFVFEPDASVGCPVNDTLFVVVTNTLRPRLADIGPLCRDSEAPLLPATDEDGISGTWSPAIIDTKVAGTTTYVFTPDAGYSCAVPGSINITIEELPFLEAFDPAPVCEPSVIDLTADEILVGDKTGLTFSYWQDAETTIAVDKPDSIWYSGIYFIKAINLAGCDTTLAINVFINPIPELIVNSPEAVCEPLTVDLADDRIVAGSDPGLIYTYWADSAMTIPIDDPNNIAVGGRYYICAENAGNCRIVKGVDVTIHRSVTTDFAQIGPFCQDEIAPSLPDIDLNGVPGTWAPDTIITTTPGTYEFVFTPDPTLECAVPDTIQVTVNPVILPEFDPIDPICQNEPAPALPVTDKNGITGTWAPSAIATDVAGTFTFVFTPDAGQGCVLNDTIEVVVNPTIVPEFDPLAAVCQGTAAPALPTTDKNGITGTWVPSLIDTQTAGTFEFVFTPDAGQGCTINDTLTITVTPAIVPEFDLANNFCVGEVPPALPLVDNNGVTGTWLPDTISTQTAGTYTFVFTPDIGLECADNDTLTVTVNPSVLPEFDLIDPICQNEPAPALPVTDKNGITGTWAPSAIATDVAGTFTFVFTPDAGQGCVLNDTIDVVVNPTIVPEFDPLAAVCQGTAAPALPTTDKNGITGTWVPSLIDTQTAGTFEFVFTPATGQGCTVNDTLTITVTPAIVPEFDLADNFCVGEVPPALPLADNNGVTGTWLPDTISTQTAGTYTFVFTPDIGLECADNDTLTVTVNPSVLPEFDLIDPICQDEPAPALPLTDKNGITGTWAPSAITTDIAGTFTFIFTPAAGQGCVLNDTIEVVVNPTIVPEFDPLAAVCQGTAAPALPTTDKNGITGTWVPSLIDTQTAGTFEFVFTPATGQGCTVNDTLTITVTPAIIPEFDLADNFCVGEVPPALPLVDNNGVAGTWSPSAITTAIAGTINYTFTPAPGVECAEPLTVAITVHENPAPVVEAIQPDCNIRLGMIVVTSATAGLEFSLDGSAFAAYPAGGYTDLAAGTYILVTRNSNLCEVSDTLKILVAPEIPDEPVLAEVPANCDETTRAFDVVSPVGTEFEYSIDGTTWQASRNFSGLAPATYTLRVRNLEGCQNSATITLDAAPSAPAEPELTAVAPTCDVPTGSITVTTPTGTGLEYSIDGTNWQSAPLFENLTPGDYTVRVRNSALCENNATVTIDPVPDMPAKPVVDITQPNCDVVTGSLTVTQPLGADLVYSIDGNTWQTDPQFTGLAAGTYTVWVRNEADCKSSDTFDIIPSTGISLADVVVSHVLCYGESNGSITMTAATGPNPVISWTGPNGFTETSLNISGLGAGSYSLNITDDNLCEKDTVIVIRQPDSPLNAIALSTNVTRPYANDGTITLDIGGGTPGYNVTWTGPDGYTATTQNITGLAAGVYTATITDQNGCPFNLPPVTITQPDGTVTLPEPAPMVLCPTAPLPAVILTYPEYITAIGAGTTDCPEGFDESTFKLVSEVSDGLKCPETIVRTYQIEDKCGMTATVEHVFIKNDNVRPNFNFPNIITVECQAEVSGYPRFRTLDEFINAGGFASDNCAIDPSTFKYAGDSQLEGTECDGMIRRRYTVEDFCGNQSTAEVQFRIFDDRGPRVRNYKRTLTSECTAPAPYRNINDFRADGGVADDNDCGNITLKLVKTDTISRSCPMELVRHYELTDRCGNITTFEQTIIVDDNTVPVFAAIPDFLGECEPGMEAKINQWLRDVTATDNCGIPVITHDFDMSKLPADCCGDLVVTFTATDKCNNSETTTGIIRLKAKVSVDIDPVNALACEGSSVTFTAEPHNGGTNPRFQWYRNGTAVAGQTGITYTVNNPQAGDRVYVRLTSDIVCTDVKEANSPVATITITNILTPAVSVAPLNPDICEGETVTFTATPVNGGTNPAYQWLVNGQPVTGATGASFTYAPADQDQITVRMTSDLVCVVTPTATSAPAVAKVIPNLVVTVDLSANRDTVCQGEPVTLQAVHENGGTNPLFTWYVNNNAVPGNNADTYTFIPDKGDVVRVTLTSSERCVVDRTVSSGIHTLDVLVIDPVTIVCPPDVTFECLGSVPPITDIDEMINLGYIRNAHHANRSSLNHIDRLSKTPQETVILRTYYIEDLCGKVDSCTQRITVSDNEPPVAVPRDVTVYLDETGVYTVDRDDILESASDNCTPFDKLKIIAVPPMVDCDDVGKVIEVKITVIDEAGNESDPVYANITVLDQMPPEALCRDITVYLDEDGKATITPADIDNGSTDNCQIVSRTLDRTTFDCNSVGVNPVRLTVVDASGNMDFCDAMVTVIDTIAPVAICQSVDIQIGPNGQVRLSPTMVDGGSYDNCGVPSLKIEPEFLTCENIGENIVTLYVTDRYGNVSSCQTIVNVLGNTPPIARDDNVKALMNQNTMILILLNDTDAEGDIDPSTVWIMTPPEHGSLSVNPSGTVTYKPFDNYLGPDTFTYRVCDNGLPCFEMCDTAVVTITVVEDNLAPIARDDEYEAGCLAISGNILTNDNDPDGDNIFLSPYLILPPANGEIELNPNGSFLYVSKSGYVGLDSLIYQICDDGYPSKCDTATVTFNVFKDEDCDGEPDEGPLTFFIPEGFSPNGDGVHDFFQILGIEDYPDAKLYIFNRWGNKLFEKEHYGNLTYWGSPEEAWWWGYSEASLTLGGGKVPVGNYIYILELGNGTTHTGTVMVSY